MNDYGFASRLLHRLVVGNRAVAQMTFDLEKTMFNPGAARTALLAEENHVFVTGLARSGTTVLLRSLFETGHFGSLTYRDMPFVLAPNLWSNLSGYFQKKGVAKMRAHGDGILVDFDSPEALDEVFWRVMCGEDYLRPCNLLPMTAPSDVVEDYQKYIALILRRYGKDRYLSKNNNNILRIGSLLRAFPDATILVPYRDPVQQALSLLKQHKRFTSDSTSDAFLAKYMTWLAHHEFGSDHRPFRFDAETTVNDMNSLNYWLFHWSKAYNKLLIEAETHGANMIFVGYENLCSDPAVFARILERLNLSVESTPDFRLSQDSIDTPPDSALLRIAMHVNADLMAKAL